MDLQSTSYILLWIIVAAESIAILVLVRIVGSIMLGSREAIERDGLVLGSAAPDFTGYTVTGEKFLLSQSSSQWVALIFASPACSICRSVIPTLAALSQDLGEAVQFLVLLRGGVDDARLFWEATDHALRVIAIGENEIANRYRVRVSPYLQVIDAQKTVRAKGLVNERGHVEHFLAEAGVDDPALKSHVHSATSFESSAF